MQVETSDMILFWQDDSIYSNWYEATYFTLNVENEKSYFSNSEAAFMYCKSLIFKDKETALLIYDDQNPRNCKKYGRLVKNFDEALWIKVREEVMYHVVKEKFTQNKNLKDELLSTSNKELVEASPYDKIWGIGLAPNDPLALDKKRWKGLNLLGKVLMQVREQQRRNNVR